MYGKSRRSLGFLTFTGGISLVTGAFRRVSDVYTIVKGSIVIFSLILYKAFKGGRGVRLLDVIVRDGTMIYFSYEPFSLFTDKTLTMPNRVLFTINPANMFNLRFSPPLLRSSTATVTNVLSATLVSRLVLNLREQNATPVQLHTTVETVRRFQGALPVAQESQVV
ncbi:hypothetical protein BC827DRAFT_1159444 [Russula dissimulans]|nr:hypothetical protein BC827DRAFT_1159444 [Russula dissimulans]